MLIIKARFDGEKVVLPKNIRSVRPGEVIVIFENAREREEESRLWEEAQEAAFAKVWDNNEDSDYDRL